MGLKIRTDFAESRVAKKNISYIIYRGNMPKRTSRPQSDQQNRDRVAQQQHSAPWEQTMTNTPLRIALALTALLIGFTPAASATWAVPVSLEEYQRRSDVIAEFEVIDRWNAKKTTFQGFLTIDDKRKPSTRTSCYLFYEMRVLRAYKGVESGETIRVRSLGGTCPWPDGRLVKIKGPGTYDLEIGQKVFMFAVFEPINNEYIATSQSLTVFRLVTKPDGGTILQSYFGGPVFLTDEEIDQVADGERTRDDVETTLDELRALLNAK